MHIRWSHGSYGGLKCSSTGKSAGSIFTLRSLITLRAACGQRWQNRHTATWRVMFSHRVTAYPRSKPSSLVSRAFSLSRDGTGRT